MAGNVTDIRTARKKRATPHAVPDDERGLIATALLSGDSVQAVARRFNRGKATVHRIATAEQIPRSAEKVAQTAAASAAHRDYTQPARLDAINTIFDRVLELVAETSKASEVKDLAMAAAILIDKRRLEEGEATSRTETNQTDAHQRLLERVRQIKASAG